MVKNLKILEIEPVVIGKQTKPMTGLVEAHTHFFQCPACNYAHCFTDTEVGYNGNAKKPTFKNMLHIPGHLALFKCRSSVLDGKITFAHDCTHQHALQTLEIPNIS